MGRKRLPWIKLWVDILSDPKMARLSVAERGCWDGILLLAQQSPIRGKLMLTDTQPMTIKDIAKAQRLTSRETGVLKSCISKMTELGSIRSNNNGALEITHFIERQEKYPSDVENHRKQPRDDPGMTQGIPRDDPATAQEIKKPQKKSVLKSDVTTKSTQQNPPNAPDKLLINSENIAEKLPIDQRERKRGGDSNSPLLRKGARNIRADPIVNDIFSEMRAFLGYPEKTKKIKVCGGDAVPAIEESSAMTADRRDPIPNYGKEGKAIKRMLTRGFTRDEILDHWKSKVSQRGEYVSMFWVNEDIGKATIVVRSPPQQEQLKDSGYYKELKDE